MLRLIAALALSLSLSAQQTSLQKVTINYPTRSAGSWALFIAKEGGYYAKYGLDVELEFGSGPAGFALISSGKGVMSNASMEQSLQASARDTNVFVAMGSSLNKGPFSLMAVKGIGSVKDLKGKRLAVSALGDAPYNYTVALLAKSGLKPRDVQWITVGTDATARASALAGGRADATLVTAPQYFRLEEQGFKNLANLADYDDVYASNVFLFSKAALAANPKLAESVMKAHIEAIQRFYADRTFAIKAYIAYDKQTEADVARIYDTNAKLNLLERVPYVMANAVRAVKAQADADQATQVRSFDLKALFDNSLLDRLAKEGFFEKVYGPGIKSEVERKSKQAFR